MLITVLIFLLFCEGDGCGRGAIAVLGRFGGCGLQGVLLRRERMEDLRV